MFLLTFFVSSLRKHGACPSTYAFCARLRRGLTEVKEALVCPTCPSISPCLERRRSGLSGSWQRRPVFRSLPGRSLAPTDGNWVGVTPDREFTERTCHAEIPGREKVDTRRRLRPLHRCASARWRRRAGARLRRCARRPPGLGQNDPREAQTRTLGGPLSRTAAKTPRGDTQKEVKERNLRLKRGRSPPSHGV